MENFKYAWRGFKSSKWSNGIDLRDFIVTNFTEYDGDSKFLTNGTEATKKLWDITFDLIKKEKECRGGVLDFDPRLSSITAYQAGYINRDLEKIVGLQTERPLCRAYMPFGSIQSTLGACKQHGLKSDDKINEIFLKYRKTHNQGCFDAYTDEMRMARKVGIITGLPDTYARGRIIGDYRRIALYGLDYLVQDKIDQLHSVKGELDEHKIKLREELSEQIKALKQVYQLGKTYGFDLSQPASNAKEAIQWTYFGYLATIKEQNGAAMSFGRNMAFFDIYIERDLKEKTLTEVEAQELIDNLIIKLRIVRFLRSKEYDDIFAENPVWATESIAGMCNNGKSFVTKTAYRILNTLNIIGPSAEPNLTVLWSSRLPTQYKEFCAEHSIKYSCIQYESDEIIRLKHGDDYAIACCVSPMALGKEMQFFGARANFPKALLYAINNGRDEMLQELVPGPALGKLESNKPLVYEEVLERYKKTLTWLAGLYTNTLNIIHYMHDKYYYEAIEMAFHDRDVKRYFATGIAGLSIATDSLSAIKHAKVTPVMNELGVATEFKIEGDFPKYGNNDDRVDSIAKEIIKFFTDQLKEHKTYRDAEHSTSILTITSNVMYGKKTGATPNGRKAGTPFSPGANPTNKADASGAIASLASVAKIPFEWASDGISNTFTIIPEALGKNSELKVALNKKACQD